MKIWMFTTKVILHVSIISLCYERHLMGRDHDPLEFLGYSNIQISLNPNDYFRIK
jgi:hypothetical protein